MEKDSKDATRLERGFVSVFEGRIYPTESMPYKLLVLDEKVSATASPHKVVLAGWLTELTCCRFILKLANWGIIVLIAFNRLIKPRVSESFGTELKYFLRAILAASYLPVAKSAFP